MVANRQGAGADVRTDHSGRITMLSLSATDMFDYTREESLGQRPVDFYTYPKETDAFLALLHDSGQAWKASFATITERKQAEQLNTRLGNIVEDNQQVGELTVNLLTGLGYEPLHITDGHAAIEQLEGTQGIEMVLTDIVLPGSINGVELAFKVHQMLTSTNDRGIPLLSRITYKFMSTNFFVERY